MSFTFFYGKDSPFSNFHQSGEKFQLFGQKFNCAEQAIMWSKAWLFGDTEKAEQILEEKSPKAQKKLGREVGGYDETMWKAMRMQVVYMVLQAKFCQSAYYKQELLKTKATMMVEASPYDKVYGIGLNEEDAENTNPSQWPGKNILGKIMTKLKREIAFNEIHKKFDLEDILNIGINAKKKELSS